MSTPSVYDTPPDGDFARYVDELGRASAARVLQAGGVGLCGAPSAAQRRPPRMAQPGSTIPATAARAAPGTRGAVFAPVRQVLLVGIAVWVAYLVGSAVFPPLAVIGWPLLIFFIVAAGTRLKSLPWADLASVARREAEHKLKGRSPPP